MSLGHLSAILLLLLIFFNHNAWCTDICFSSLFSKSSMTSQVSQCHKATTCATSPVFWQLGPWGREEWPKQRCSGPQVPRAIPTGTTDLYRPIRSEHNDEQSLPLLLISRPAHCQSAIIFWTPGLLGPYTYIYTTVSIYLYIHHSIHIPIYTPQYPCNWTGQAMTMYFLLLVLCSTRHVEKRYMETNKQTKRLFCCWYQKLTSSVYRTPRQFIATVQV